MEGQAPDEGTLEDLARRGDIAEAKVRHSYQLAQRDGTIRALRAEVKEAHAARDSAQRQLEDLLAIREPEPLRPIEPRHGTATGEATAVAVASDWHVEEEVTPSTVEGRNRYNLDVAEARARAYFRRVLRIVEKERSHIRVDALVLCLLGDFLTNYLHEENVETALLGPIPAARFAKRLLSEGIEFLLEHGKFAQIVVPCTMGNHGRLTKRNRNATKRDTNLEFGIYADLEERYGGDDRIQFSIADGPLIHWQVYGRTLRANHGDDFSYGGAQTGLIGPFQKQVWRWDQAPRADLTLVGHWHQYNPTPFGIVNGSLIGYSAYSSRFGYEEPKQAFTLIHKDRGRMLDCPIWVD